MGPFGFKNDLDDFDVKNPDAREAHMLGTLQARSQSAQQIVFRFRVVGYLITPRYLPSGQRHPLDGMRGGDGVGVGEPVFGGAEYVTNESTTNERGKAGTACRLSERGEHLWLGRG